MKKRLFLVIAACLVFAGCGGGSADSEKETADKTKPTESSMPEFDLEEYKTLVSELNQKIMDESVLLSNMGNYEHNFWESLSGIGGTVDYDQMVEKTYDWMSRKGNVEQETVTNNYSEICTMYKDIASKDVQGKEAEELYDNVKEIYSSFDALYLLVTQPSGDIASFSSDFNEYVDEIKSINSLLITLLGEK